MLSPSGSSHIDQEDVECEHDGTRGGPMLPIFLNDLMRTNNDQNNEEEVVEVRLEIDKEENINVVSRRAGEGGGIVKRILRRLSSVSSGEEIEEEEEKREGRVERTRSGAERALKGLRFISGNSNNGGKMDEEELWKLVERRFKFMAKDGLISRDDFGECIGMVDSKEFAVCIFDALSRRKMQKLYRISKDELRDFWLQLSDQSFDARLQIFFDMADSNGDGRITREEVQELIMLSASANKLSKLKEQAGEYASLIMEELDPDNLGYIELWQLQTLLLQRDTYLNYSRPLSTESRGSSQNLNSLKPHTIIRQLYLTLSSLILENWQRVWILALWVTSMAWVFGWKFDQYRSTAAFHVMGYCLPTAKGAAETLKLNMALILLPVCRNTLTWLQSTKARSIIPFNDNINFHKMIACAIAIGVIIHAGNHLFCDFPRLIHSSPRNFASIASDFHDKEPTYKDLLRSVEGITGISMVVLMVISFILATRQFRKSMVKLPQPLSRLTGFNAFWYSHHLLGLVYILLLVHGSFLFLAHKWYQKTTWMYVSAPMLVYIAERSVRACRSKHYSVRILKVSVLPGSVFSLTMSKPLGFKYRSGQYLFLQCPSISSLEWHPFSMTSAPGDDHLLIHIRTVGDWTQELKHVLTEVKDSPGALGQAEFSHQRNQLGQLRLLIDGPYGAPAQDYHDYEVLLLVGLGIGATPFISILRDLTNNARTPDYQTDSNTESSKSDDSVNSYRSSTLTQGGKKRLNRTTAAHFVWVTRDPGSFEWFKEVLDEVAELDHKGQIEMQSYLTSMYEEGDARSTLITLVQTLNHAKHGVDILSGTRVKTHFARPNWRQLLTKIASKHPFITVGVFYCGMPLLAKELKKLCHELNRTTTTRFEFHKEHF